MTTEKPPALIKIERDIAIIHLRLAEIERALEELWQQWRERQAG